MDKASKKYRTSFIYLTLALATFALYLPVREYDFVNYDDPEYVTANPAVRAGLTYKGLLWASATGHAGNWHPVTWLSHMLDCEIFGLDPACHHLTNLLLHTANTLLLFFVLFQLTAALWPSAFVAAAFALHPLHVESVAWIAERKDVLSTLFWLLTVTAYVRYVKEPDKIRYLLALLCFALGLMAKPMLVTLPIVLLLLDYWPLGRFESPRTPAASRAWWAILRQLVREKAPFFVLSVLSCVITFLVQRIAGAVVKSESIPFMQRLANALVSYVKYIEKMFLPGKLAVFYPHPHDTLSKWQVLFALVLLLSISAIIIRFARNRRYLVTGWFWYIITLLPVIGLVQVGSQARADRYSYVPLIGLFVIVAWTAGRLLEKFKYQKALAGTLLLAGTLAMATCTHLQLQNWRSSITLFEHALKVTKGNYVAHYHLARALADEARVDEAIIQLRQTLLLKPHRFDIINTLARLLAVYKQAELHDPAEAIGLARLACESAGYKDPLFLDTLAVCYAAAGRFYDAQQSAQRALDLAENAGEKALVQRIQSHLLLFRDNKPYFETLTGND